MTAYALSIAQEVNDVFEPTSYTEAVSCADSSKWLVVMNEKIKSLHKNGTWALTELPKGKWPLRDNGFITRKTAFPGLKILHAKHS